MEGKKEEWIRKGPWKEEEDEVLLKHVKKYGPRDWSSIRSKGLLERTGKSCRLRWVNKLRPNLKNGCKFSLEEERIVIELQSQFGNKWARIATYLPGRTDNDVKNFWSSRQKRLSRILHASSSPTPSKSHKKNYKNDASQYVPQLPPLKDPTFSVTSEAESSSKPQSVSTFCIDNNSEIIKMVPVQDLVKPKLFSFEQDLLRPVFNPTDQSLYIDSQSVIPFSPTPFHHQLDLTFPSEETQQRLAGLDDFYFDISAAPMDAFKFRSLAQLPVEPPFSAQPDRNGNNASETIDNFVTTAGYFDDFPADIFDQMEPFPNPSSSD